MRFLRFLEKNELPTQLDRIDKTNIRQFILYLQQEAKTPHKNKPLTGDIEMGPDGKPILPRVKIPYTEIEAMMKKEAVTPS